MQLDVGQGGAARGFPTLEQDLLALVRGFSCREDLPDPFDTHRCDSRVGPGLNVLRQARAGRGEVGGIDLDGSSRLHVEAVRAGLLLNQRLIGGGSDAAGVARAGLLGKQRNAGLDPRESFEGIPHGVVDSAEEPAREGDLECLQLPAVAACVEYGDLETRWRFDLRQEQVAIERQGLGCPVAAPKELSGREPHGFGDAPGAHQEYRVSARIDDHSRNHLERALTALERCAAWDRDLRDRGAGQQEHCGERHEQEAHDLLYFLRHGFTP